MDKRFLAQQKNPATDILNTASQRAFQKAADATGDLFEARLQKRLQRLL